MNSRSPILKVILRPFKTARQGPRRTPPTVLVETPLRGLLQRNESMNPRRKILHSITLLTVHTLIVAVPAAILAFSFNFTGGKGAPATIDAASGAPTAPSPTPSLLWSAVANPTRREAQS